jgi:acyl-coenzyme A synthetase/AMP-(fatty) acid ligase
VHLHRGLLAFPRGLGGLLGITAADRVLSTAKLPFGYGFGNSLLLPFSVGASVVLFEGRVDPYAVSGLLSRYRPTLLFAVPTLYAALLAMPGAAERLDLSSVRTAVSAGEHLGAALSNRLTDAFGLRVVNGLGSTECLHIFVATEPGVTEPGLTGEPVPGFEVQVVDDHGRVLPDGGTGRLRVRGPSAADRYWRRPDLGAEVFDQGWVHTGDIMRREPGLGWRYLGREDNVLNVGGAKVLTSEIEEVLQTLPGVGSCAVVGVPDQDEVVRIVAHVVPVDADDGQLRTRLAAGLRAALPPHKRPSTIRVVAELPTTSTGKTARFRIRQTEWERTR